MLSSELAMSKSEVFNGFERCKEAGLITENREQPSLMKKQFFDLMVYGAPRVFYGQRGEVCKGMPTSVHARSLKELKTRLVNEGDQEENIPMVWPCSRGTVKGESLTPIYPSVPEAAEKDAVLYEMLALLDIIRVGSARGKKLATEFLRRKILGKEENG